MDGSFGGADRAGETEPFSRSALRFGKDPLPLRRARPRALYQGEDAREPAQRSPPHSAPRAPEELPKREGHRPAPHLPLRELWCGAAHGEVPGVQAGADRGRRHGRRIGAEGLKELVHNGRVKALTPLYGEITAKYIADSPEVIFAGLIITIWLTPMLIALLGFDSFAGDVQHRTIRYWTVRARRGSFFAGKFLGLWTTVSAVTLAIHALIWVVCIARGEATAAETLSWGIRFWVVSLPMSAAWCGVAVLVSSFFRMPMVALLTTFAAYFALWLVWVIGVASDTSALLYFYPNYYDKLLLSPQLWTAASGFGACALMATLCVGGGTLLFSKRDV